MLQRHESSSQYPELEPKPVRNVDTDKVLVYCLKHADTFWLRLAGLIPSRGLDPGHGLLLTPCASIHTFFMGYPIDVVYLDPDFTVVGAFSRVKPWRILPAVPGTGHVLEIPAGVLADTGTLVGHTLEVPGPGPKHQL